MGTASFDAPDASARNASRPTCATEASGNHTSKPMPTVRPEPDEVLIDIADQVTKYRIGFPEAYGTARVCLVVDFPIGHGRP
jgi:hypothetical protein